jgi:hypothetical protein
MSVQALILPALAALHNFIWQYNPEKIHIYDDDDTFNFQMDTGPVRILGTGPVTLGEVH